MEHSPYPLTAYVNISMYLEQEKRFTLKTNKSPFTKMKVKQDLLHVCVFPKQDHRSTLWVVKQFEKGIF